MTEARSARNGNLRTVLSVAAASAALAIGAMAAAPVEESQGSELRRSAEVAAAYDDADASAPRDAQSDVNGMYYEFQLMQDEVRRLHGVVEELNHRIALLEREQRERYVELDQRLMELRPNGTGVEGADATPGVGGDVPAVPVTEREAYNAAIALVNNARPLPESERRSQYQRALELFQDIIKEYPNGEFTPNAFYWIGEVHQALGAHEDARQAFALVLVYEDHPKVPDALYKLGVAYEFLGDTERAREYLNQVIGEYPASTAAGLARTFLSELP